MNNGNGRTWTVDRDVGFSEEFHGFGDEDTAWLPDPDAEKPAIACIVPPRAPERTPEICEERLREAEYYAADETLPPDLRRRIRGEAAMLRRAAKHYNARRAPIVRNARAKRYTAPARKRRSRARRQAVRVHGPPGRQSDDPHPLALGRHGGPS
jgi:hypothetical protein